jgi:hypothetical protein
MCQKHYWRVRRHGDMNVVNKPPGWPGAKGDKHPSWVGDNATNSAVHFRIAVARGKASEYMCIKCGVTADDWAYQYNCDSENQSARGPYSLDINKYEPMCSSCHRYFDNEMSGRTSAAG